MTIPKTPLRFIWHFMRQYPFFNLTIIMLNLARGTQAPVSGWFTKQLLDGLPSAKENASILIFPAIGIVMSYWLIHNILSRLSGMLEQKYEQQIKNNIINSLFEYVLGASREFFHGNSVGGICGQITSVANDFMQINTGMMVPLLLGIGQIFLSLFLLYKINIQLFYVLLIYVIAYFSFAGFMCRKILPYAYKYSEAVVQLNGEIGNIILNHTNVEIHNSKKHEISWVKSFLDKLNLAFQERKGYTIWTYFIQCTMTSTMTAVMLYLLIKFYSQNLVTIGDFGLFLRIIISMQTFLQWISLEVGSAYQALGGIKNGLSHLLVRRNVRDVKDAADLIIREKEIKFDSVNFGYDKKVFENLSFKIAPKSKIALVGYSGVGKTTLINLILRFYDISGGKITIDGQDIREVNQKSLRDNIGLIPQDPVLFNRSILENIRYGRVSASDDEVVDAAKKAHAHDFIMELPDRYETAIGKSQLSGGQRQKIAIARAVLKNAPILILDEPTSSLDYQSEKHIQASLKEFMEGKTVIAIAHRLSTIISMDRIIVINDGKIVQDGDHATLLNEKGIYSELVMATL